MATIAVYINNVFILLFVANFLFSCGSLLHRSPTLTPNDLLVEAIILDNIPKARKAIKMGADVNGLGTYDHTRHPTAPIQYTITGWPIWQASARGKTPIVAILIQAGAEVNIENGFGYTPLTEAAAQGHVEIVSLLINAGAEVNHIAKHDGHTSLTLAAWRGKSQVVKVLLQHKTNVHVAINSGETAVQLAYACGHKNIVQQLVQAGSRQPTGVHKCFPSI